MALIGAKYIEGLVILGMFLLAAQTAYTIRLYAIINYGRVIHEFDPWFNFRATQYLADNGWERFTKWFDYESWYPLGRPVGTTIYPGMQIISVLLWTALRWKGWKKYLGMSLRMTLNDVCVFVPCWFGSVASIVTGLLAHEVSGSWRAGGVAALIMSIIPAHIMRSVGGGYDNESVAMTAMVLTFYLWTRSLRTPSSWYVGAAAGAAYAFMAAAWGGFIFVGNMVAVHAALLVAFGYFSSHLHKSYTLWYIVGVSGAIQIPVIGMSPFKSMEQVAPLLVFAGLQFLAFCDYMGARKGLTWKDNFNQMLQLRITYASMAAGAAVIPIAYLAQAGYFGPLSVRVRSLFIKHTKTGNPLVDSVAEHQPASADAYWHHLHYMYFLAMVGFLIALFKTSGAKERQYHGVQVTKWFIIAYYLIANYFSNKMSRLIILQGPVASVLGAIAIVSILEWAFAQSNIVVDLFKQLLRGDKEPAAEAAAPAPATAAPAASPARPEPGAKDAGSAKKDKKAKREEKAAGGEDLSNHPLAPYKLTLFAPMYDAFVFVYDQMPVRMLRVVIMFMVLFRGPFYAMEFYRFSDAYARQMSHPSIMFRARLQDGTEVMVNDYQEAYWWLRDNTPRDSRVLSWWDYGYQINGIANRTTLADGNTWNLEHIALVGRMLASPEEKAHSVARHLADYVLIWAGNQGDDLAKSPHMARISNSVYHDVCPGDPLCRTFGFYDNNMNSPTPSMANSMLFKMHSHEKRPGVRVNPKLFQEAYSSKYGLVRIFKVLDVDEDSKAWLADPANRKCDAPGSWYCPGQYPPSIGPPPSSHMHLDYDDPASFAETKRK